MHHLEGFWTNDAFATQISTASQHLTEPIIVSRGTRQTTSAREKGRLLQIRTVLRIVNQFQGLVGIAIVIRRQSVLVFLGNMKGCI